MSPFVRTASGWGILLTILLLVVTLLKQLIALVTFLIAALKVGVVVLFIALFALIVIAMLRGRRSRKRDEAEL